MKTIVAISTPTASGGGVAMLRISGDDALTVAGKVFMPYNNKPVTEMEGYTAAYGKIKDGNIELDDGVLLIYLNPKSYTGEDVAEITCHGGIYVARRVLQACINAGAALANAGDFTKRAVLNGKMTLTQAESVIDVINSINDQYLSCSNAQKSGSLYRKIEQIAAQILTVSSHIAAWIDYPDEGLDHFEISSHIGQLSDCRLQLSLLLKTYDIASIMREGIVTSIVGKPNAGKSTLMNLLTRRERSIVTDIPGTTRDIIEDTVNMGEGIILKLCDCAGIRETDDKIEQIGIEYMYRQIENSSLILAVFDNSCPLEKDDYALIERIDAKNSICVINKTDLPNALDLTILSTRFKHVVQICAKSQDSLESLATVIKKVSDVNSLDLSAGFIANERQRICVIEAEELLTRAINGMESSFEKAPLDATGFLLENTLEALYRLSGKSVSAEIIDEVFKNFCVGK